MMRRLRDGVKDGLSVIFPAYGKALGKGLEYGESVHYLNLNSKIIPRAGSSADGMGGRPYGHSAGNTVATGEKQAGICTSDDCIAGDYQLFS